MNIVSGLTETGLADQITNLTKFIIDTNNNLDDFFLYINGILVLCKYSNAFSLFFKIIEDQQF